AGGHRVRAERTMRQGNPSPLHLRNQEGRRVAMSAKQNLLRNAMLGVQHADAPKPSTTDSPLVEQPTPPAPTKQAPVPSRIGKRSVSGHFDPLVQKQLRQLAVEN